MTWKTTTLWRRTLGQEGQAPGVERLRQAYERMRAKTEILAKEIARDLPDYTVHDITHIDALWGVASTIAGTAYSINPLEAFVLGGAFLVHDLGMGVASWTDRERSLKATPEYRDTVASLLRKDLERAPSAAEIDSAPESIVHKAISETLRQLHAEQASRLVDARWHDDERGGDHVLLEDEDLRFHLGSLIGRIGHSHWWEPDRLIREFPTVIGALAGLPNEWSIDPVKVAALLRVTDAAHLDDRRAPRLLRIARGLSGVSRAHWIFQGHLTQPREDGGRLVFSAPRPFGAPEADAWWLAREALHVVDRELHAADALLADTRRDRFAARTVAGVESPIRLADYLRVLGWEPVEARVRVGDVAGLVGRLGGRELYGNDTGVPLRELIQNATDAVVARRVIETRPVDWGRITVRVGHDGGAAWLEVEDTGLGMSKGVLTGPLLDFGTTYWTSSLCREEHPGLVAGGFEPIGRYGIGFFSVFMWGERVRVTSRPHEAGTEATMVLEFATGLRANPVLRTAEATERLRDGGTRVRVWLRSEPGAPDGGCHPLLARGTGLAEVCRITAPALAVDLYVESEGKESRIVQANDWITIPAVALIERLTPAIEEWTWPEAVIWRNQLADRIRPVLSDSRAIVGRACIADSGPVRVVDGHRNGLAPPSAITAGGIRCGSSGVIAGLLVGRPTRADRTLAVPVADIQATGRWATEQRDLLSSAQPDSDVHPGFAGIIHMLGGDVGDLAIALGRKGYLNASQVRATCRDLEEVILVSLRTYRNPGRELADGVFEVESGRASVIQSSSPAFWRHVPDWPTAAPARGADWFYARTLVACVVGALSQAWGVPEERIWEAAEFSTDEVKHRRAIWADGGTPEIVNIIHKPVVRKPK